MRQGSPMCFRCLRTPAEIDEYAIEAAEEGIDPDQFMREEEGTYNPAFNTFCCTHCYIQIGMPASDEGWKAPEILEGGSGSNHYVPIRGYSA